MIEFKNIAGIYFAGIGGIGMSALALYFAKGGFTISGYDRTESTITGVLAEAGCGITYEDDINNLPELFKNVKEKSRVIIVFTPAIPAENKILSFFRDNGFCFRRSTCSDSASRQFRPMAIHSSFLLHS
jgi:UDP-N-acetylmuramate--alanine ligase